MEKQHDNKIIVDNVCKIANYAKNQLYKIACFKNILQ